MTRPLVVTTDHLVNAAGWTALAVIAVAAVKVATWRLNRRDVSRTAVGRHG
jgi:cytochrome oxidase assembly protein ShyY1